MKGRVLLLLLMSALSVVTGRQVKLSTLQNAETLYDTTVTPPAGQTATLPPKISTPPKCYTPEEAADLCNRLDEEENGYVDINEYITNWLQSKEWKNFTDWRDDIKRTSERNKYLFANHLYTDCTFIVGPDNATQEIHAHRLLLLRASKVFEAIFGEDGLTKRGPIRVMNVTPSLFTNMINYIYNDDVCIDSFDEACEMIGLSDMYELPLLKQHSKAYLWSSLFPNNVWRGYRCAVTNNDSELMQSALQFTQRWTEETLNDPKFTELPQHALMAFLAQDALNSSEELIHQV
ncbi:hypothetical protein B566_EDAN001435 [Ephemera danica]|nr:hypothetical protein B566_EDAN001435 [Ephemera danica]